MKKIIGIVMCIVILAFMAQPISAQGEIEGLHEKLSKLFMENCFTEEEIESMNNTFMQAEAERFRTVVIPTRKAMRRMRTNSEEEELELEMNELKTGLNYSNAVRISMLSTYRYAAQYAEAGNFKYLFSGNEYWMVSEENYSDRTRFAIDGRYIPDMKEEFGVNYNPVVLKFERIKEVKDEEKICKMLNNLGENLVTDIRLFSIAHCMTFLYIRCEENEYLLKLYAHTGSKELLKDILYDSLYKASDVMSAIIEDANRDVSKNKPTHEAEAEALQSEGLLYGNENGLDLLKPMTRIEAVTMILRAIGNDSAATKSVFADVPAWHWGYNAANVAYELGITSGVGEGEFAPERTVTAEEFSAMLLRLTNVGDFDWQDSVNILVENGIISSEDALTMDLFTRGDMAKIIYEIRAHGLL